MEPTSIPEFKDISWRWIAYVASTMIIIAFAFCFFHEVEMKQDVQCEIVSSSEVKIRGLAGLVTSVNVRPLARVAQGAPLFSLQRDLSLSSDGRQRAQFDSQMRDEQIRVADEQYSGRRAQLLAQRDTSILTLSSRKTEAAALGEQIEQNRQLAGESQRKLERLTSVSDYVTAERIEQARADGHQAKVAVAQGVARREQLLGEIASLKGTKVDLDAQLRENDARHEQSIQTIQMRFEQGRQDATISAPLGGVVTFSRLVPGHMLEASEVALVISTGGNGALRAALRIPSRRRGFVEPGQTVRLKFDAFPYARFGTYEARIDAISDTTIQPTPGLSGMLSAQGGGDGDYMAWATLSGTTFGYGKQRFDILPGMHATASIVVERRTIAEWVFEPLFRMIRG